MAKPRSETSVRVSPKVWPLVVLSFCLGGVAARVTGLWLDRAAVPPAPSANQVRVEKGPWGTLEITSISIERPDEFISVNPELTPTNQWYFEGFTAGQLGDFFKQKDLNTAQQGVLTDEGRWRVSTQGIYVTPGCETILSLSPEARQRIYTVLSSNAVNYYQHFPFLIQAKEADEWFKKNGLSPATDRLVRGLLYRRGNALCFADMVEALSRIPTPEEKRRLAKMFSRQATLLVKLRVEEGEDVEPLINYWGKFGLAKDVRPLLESLARTPGGATLDIAHLLPPFARERLYTYPFPSETPIASRRDCFWSSMNFFNAEPDDRFAQFDEVRRIIQSDYYPVQGDPTFGDVVWFIDASGTVVHSAVYLAGNCYFTKNGANFNEPWTVMSLDDLLADYAIHASLRLVAYRSKRA